MSWIVNTSEEFDNWLFSLTDAEQTDILASIKVLQGTGHNLGRPHVDVIKGSTLKKSKTVVCTTRW